MKTKRRHELQTNILADYIGKHLQQLKPYSRHITIGILLIFTAVLVGLFFSNKWAGKRGKSWSDFSKAFAATDADALEEVANLHDGTTAALWARLSAGEIKVATGSSQLFTDREKAEKMLKDAKEHFLVVEKDAAGHPQLVERARFGLAQAHESLSDVKNAQKYYDEVARSSPNSAFGKLAKRRFDRLSDESVEGWYAWFERQEPSPPTIPPGGMGITPKVSDDLDMLPERPDLSFPGSTISDQLKDIDLDAPLGEDIIDPMSTKPEEIPAAGDGEKATTPESAESPKPDDSAMASEPGGEDTKAKVEAGKEAGEPKPQAEEPTPPDVAKPTGKPAASDGDDTEPESKDAASR